jgi:hypothetical protein
MIKSKRLKWAGNVERMSDMKTQIILFGKPEWNMRLRRFGRRWDDNIRMYLREILCEAVVCIHVTHYRGQWWTVVNTVICPRVPRKTGNILN